MSKARLLLIEITNTDPYALMAWNIKRFDTSAFAVDNQRKIPSANKKRPGFMSDEAKGHIIVASCGLRSKCCSFKMRRL